ncbi:preprotein translocase subunit SecG [Fuchsiella alkaliacetigena]|uniref:preprotein translocase subunit SecG n=1 Tax=Fuchsiella alkaliacetigena TaxID=957042 RepID=UPI00200B2CD0|nr:preprotein translocase subunit SecG [Fuchsiella alkaliacetigena]MCK8824839.1 preprotein translocase subunit SecG [Fuchsiella alkaliacetigena]
MLRVLQVIHILVAIGVIVGVLLQSGKSAGLSGAIDGGASSILGGDQRNIDKKLGKATTVVAVIFMFTSLLLGIF